MTPTEPRMPAAATRRRRREGERNDRRLAGVGLAARSPAVDRRYTTIAASRDDLPIGRDGDSVERRRQWPRSARHRAARPDAQRRVVTGAHQRGAVRGERDTVDALRVTFEHARRAAPASGHTRAVLSQDAEARLAPSGDTASATTGAV